MIESSTLTKEKIAKNLQSHIGLSLAICEDFVSKTFEEIINLTLRDEKMMIHKFGTWKIHNKKSRPGFNILKGNAVNISARNVLQFKSCKLLRDKLNAQQKS